MVAGSCSDSADLGGRGGDLLQNSGRAFTVRGAAPRGSGAYGP